MAILDSVKELASKLGAETNGRDITDQLNKINKHLDQAALSGRDIAEAVKTYSENAGGGGDIFVESIVINSFSAAPPVSEMGSSQTITLAWTLSKQATSQNINGSPVTGNSKQYTGVSSSQTYTLNVSDGQTSASKSVSISFANRIYYGAAENITGVTELTGILSNDPEITITVNAGAGEYIIYAIPARLGDVTFYVGGFEGGFENPVEQVITNDSGYQETYKVYRSTNAGLGETTIDIREV